MTYARRDILKQGATAIAASLVTRTMASAMCFSTMLVLTPMRRAIAA